MEQDILNTLKQIANGSNFSVGGAAISATNPLPVTQATLIAGEDLTNNVLDVEHKYTPFNITLNATLTMIKSSAGLLHNINIGMLSNPTITIYDNASGASGTILAHIEPQANTSKGGYLVDLSFTNGATAWVTGGNATRITGGYR